eukprot:CAMPEP_0175979770 /NCGR_PEP_ID=MMETSP0108-20121206/46425_1 /TAXON_ID=195067 ORGANISM="Goniomonas pacifica, Strain CCMP1869" /NCGR_SAMPLE_ID=MMETSP0108 /ASSEMBLY_ACC=CAM_ASM_000204 /LENGTH=133 /DNA_ID=CAMNT_0017310147 /DNA_START=299 /DNA_END=700 /DNA_ORIENTATION=+
MALHLSTCSKAEATASSAPSCAVLAVASPSRACSSCVLTCSSSADKRAISLAAASSFAREDFTAISSLVSIASFSSMKHVRSSFKVSISSSRSSHRCSAFLNSSRSVSAELSPLLAPPGCACVEARTASSSDS